GITLVIGQIATGLYYLPISPLRFGLILLGLTYALTALASGIEEQRSPSVIWVEPVIMLIVIWSMAIFVRG
ncbi:MAG: hypothetical protein ACYC7M_09720, partial [Bellilinea sp.]